MDRLLHEEIFSDSDRVATHLSLGEELETLGGGAQFPLLVDPRQTDYATIIGMFVLRPARKAWTTPILQDGKPQSLFQVDDWCFNVRDLDGGWLIAGNNPLDAMRLALQYGLADAVIVGSNTVCVEGVAGPGGPANDHQPGYLWQPYGPANWPHLHEQDDELLAKIAAVRKTWQEAGVLSERRWPAQIVVSQSGRPREGAADLLDARIFNASHPDGNAIETYVLTSEAGAQRLTRRASARGMKQRMSDMLIVLSPPGRPEELDIARVPGQLRGQLDIRIANHDGGRTVLSRFVEAGAVAQLNLTLMRDASVLDMVSRNTDLDRTVQLAALRDFDERCQLFFSGDHRLPAGLRPVSILSDDADAAVVTFDTRGVNGL